MKNNTIFRAGAVILFMLSLCGCRDEWLEPKPLSFYTPENTFVDAAGFEAALFRCRNIINDEYNGDGFPALTEMILSDFCVEGTTDKAGPQMDLDVTLLPDTNGGKLNSMNITRTGWYWTQGYAAISAANTVIFRIDNAQFSSEAERNRILGEAYFYRAYYYYKLVHQYGDVPWIDKEVSEPKTDFYSHDRWDILAQLKKDLEFAYANVPDDADRGQVTQSACGTLLMKIDICLGEYDKAIQIGEAIVAKHPLMTKRFASVPSGYDGPPRANLMFDLHSVEGKLDASNTEGLFYLVNYPNVPGSVRSQLCRNTMPRIVGVTTPDGKTGVVFTDGVEKQYEINRTYGRGIGRARATNYTQWTIWTDKEKNDIRGQYNRDSWKSPDELYYNDPKLKAAGNPYYGTHLVKNPAMSPEDSIRSWFQWPVYKLYVPDPLSVSNWGGETPMYIYRSAEVYLLMGEACYWKGDAANAAKYLNVVRQRSGADPLTASDINIGTILDERCRELCYEENRHVEHVRVAYTFAKTGKQCEYFGRTYKLDNFSGPGGTGSNVKQEGINFYYDWVMAKNNYYNKGVKHRWAEYKMSVHHVLWPVPTNALNANKQGRINQNIGYPGAENNLPPKHIGVEE